MYITNIITSYASVKLLVLTEHWELLVRECIVPLTILVTQSQGKRLINLWEIVNKKTT